jgi:serine protease Do
MTKIKKASAVIALSAVSTLAFLGGNSLLNHVEFARAADKVAATSQELQSVKDLSTVFRDVGKVVEPTVVQIEVHKTIHGATSSVPNADPFLRKFFRDHGLQMPDEGNGDAKPQDDNGDDQNAPDGGAEEVGTGSGVIMETDGDTAYILTNNHVAGGATEMTVTLADGRVIKGGKTIGADAKADLAVVKIKAGNVMHAKWGNSDELDRGDWVLAFGSPFGYVGSMTHGIVSALNRDTRMDGTGGILGRDGYENFIQVDAPINPGNSGGPLVNIRGEVVGINTAIATRSGGFQGIGLAIPSSEAKAVYAMLKEKGKVTRGWLGVAIEDVQREPGLAHSYGYNDDKGVIVQDVLANTPATGKLKEGDIVTAIDGKPVSTVQALRNEVAMIAAGTTVKLSVFRDNKETEVPLTIGEQPNDVMAMGNHGNGNGRDGSHTEASAIGLHLSNITDEIAQKFNLPDEQRKGAFVTAVDPRSPAAEQGIMPGDIIVRIAGKPVADASEAADALDKANLKEGVRLRITNSLGSRNVFVQKDQ